MSQKMWIFDMGYRHFAVPMEDGPMVLQALQSMREVESNWTGSRIQYRFTENGEPGVDGMKIAVVLEPEPPAPAPQQSSAEPAPKMIGHTPKLEAPEVPF